MPAPAGKRKETRPKRSAKGPQRAPQPQTKLRRESGVIPVPLTTRHNSGPPTHTCDRPVGAGHPPPQLPTRRYGRAQPPGTAGRGRERWPDCRPADVPTRSWPQRAPAPRGPLLCRPDSRPAENKGAAAAPPARLPAPASPRTPPQPPGPARPHSSPSPRADRPRPLDGRPGGAGTSGARQGRLGPHSPLQHQDDGEPLGNLAESGAMQTLELRCGHSMATRRAARRTDAPAPHEVGEEGLRRLRLGSLLAGRSADDGCVPSPCVKESKSFRAPGFLSRRLQKSRSGKHGNPGSGFCCHP